MNPPGLVDVLVLLGSAAVLPLALGGRNRGWAITTASVMLALLVATTGPTAGALASVWSLMVVASALVPRPVADRHPPVDPPVRLLAAGYTLVAGTALVAHCMGWKLFGVGEPIVELTVTHFTYAGAAALVLAGRNHLARPNRLTRLALVATAAAPPFVGLGFVTRAALPQVGGACLMAVGIWATCAVHLGRARRLPARSAARRLFAVSGLSALAPMVLAISWAAGQHFAVPALSIADMERAHGLVNALGFVVCGLLAQLLAERRGPLPVQTLPADPDARRVGDPKRHPERDVPVRWQPMAVTPPSASGARQGRGKVGA